CSVFIDKLGAIDKSCISISIVPSITNFSLFGFGISKLADFLCDVSVTWFTFLLAIFVNLTLLIINGKGSEPSKVLFQLSWLYALSVVRTVKNSVLFVSACKVALNDTERKFSETNPISVTLMSEFGANVSFFFFL